MKWLALMFFLVATAANAQSPLQTVEPTEVTRFLELLRTPAVQTWLNDPERQADPPAVQTRPLRSWEAERRTNIENAIEAVPRIPTELASKAARVREDAVSQGYAPILPLMAGIAMLGIVAEHLFRRQMRANSILDRFLSIGVFAASMAIILLVFPWPSLGRIVMWSYLGAFVAYRLAATVAGILLENGPIRSRSKILIGLTCFAVASSIAGHEVGVDPSVQDAISYLFSVVLLLLSIEALWAISTKRLAVLVGMSLGLVLVWMCWCLDFIGLFWLGIYAFLLPPTLHLVGHRLEPLHKSDRNNVRSVFVSRGIRALIIAAAVGWLAFSWHWDAEALIHRSPAVSAILFGLLKSVIVLLVADLVWHLAKSAIESRLAAPIAVSEENSSHTPQATRLHTLLPIFKNLLAVVVIVVTALTVLAELGVEIGPLIAGAGIFGVALGFGSQTLVKDVIGGVFYMLDDAFRVGEYIQAKNYKGTVEGFSLRSVRLRHHRGPVFTVPFGELGAVENMSRDWGVVKFRISVSYETDVEKARKLTKKIGTALMEDPELGPIFIEPLKMKGIEEFGDYGMVLSFGMTLRPSSMQSFIRRRANLLLREAFIQNGIEFATPSVQVGGDERPVDTAAATMAHVQTERVRTATGEPSS